MEQAWIDGAMLGVPLILYGVHHFLCWLGNWGVGPYGPEHGVE